MSAAPPNPNASQLAEAAAVAFTQRDFAAARDHANALLLISPDDSRALLVLGLVAIEAQDFATAQRHLAQVKAAPPRNPSALNNLGAALSQIGDTTGARLAFTRAGELGLNQGWRNLGNLESGARNWGAAIAAFQRLVATAPTDAAAHAALAHIFEIRHDLARATAHAMEAIALDPLNAVARVALARALLQQKDFVGAEAAAAPVATSDQASNNDRGVAWGVIGDARDQTSDASGAFAAFSAANQLALLNHAALLDDTGSLYHPSNVRRITALAARANIVAWHRPERFETPAPTFLVGFPRSGTTLLDQILSSHTRLICLEERVHFSGALARVIGSVDAIESYETLSDAEITTVRAAYWSNVTTEIGSAAADKLVIDKLPLNIIVLPLIKRVFPDAKIIFALRDPRDVVLSCFQHRFGMNVAMAQLLRLDTAVAYYDLVMQLMETCRQTLALDLHQARYEDVVANLEAEARALAAFLGVAYEPAMLNYRDTALKRDVATPSMRQVIQPLYSRSIGRWRRYEEQLAPILPTLKPWAARFGYPI